MNYSVIYIHTFACGRAYAGQVCVCVCGVYACVMCLYIIGDHKLYIALIILLRLLFIDKDIINK